MSDNTSWTPFPDDNLLGLIDKELRNQHEAKGITKAELYIFGLDTLDKARIGNLLIVLLEGQTEQFL